MSNNYYNLILEKLKTLIDEHKINITSTDQLLEDPQLNSMIHSVAYVANKIDEEIQISESKIYKLLINKIYDFLLNIKPSSIILNIHKQNDTQELIIRENSKINVQTKTKSYLYSVRQKIELLPIEIIESEYVQYNSILNNNYFGNYFISIKFKCHCSKESLNSKIIRFFVNHTQRHEIINSINFTNSKVYIYKNNIISHIGNIAQDSYYNTNITTKYFDYLFQYCTNQDLFAFINIEINNIHNIHEILINNNNFHILIPVDKIYTFNNFIKYNVITAYSYNTKTTPSFVFDQGYEKTIYLNYYNDENEEIIKVISLFSIDKNSKKHTYTCQNMENIVLYKTTK